MGGEGLISAIFTDHRSLYFVFDRLLGTIALQIHQFLVSGVSAIFQLSCGVVFCLDTRQEIGGKRPHDSFYPTRGKKEWGQVAGVEAINLFLLAGHGRSGKLLVRSRAEKRAISEAHG